MTTHGESRQHDRDEHFRFQEELKAADRLFAREVAAAPPTDRGRVWARWFSPEGLQILSGQVVKGALPITDLMGPVFASAGYSLTWEPDLASASAGGDMGWTSGRYESRSSGPDGHEVRQGRYLTIWRRQPDGSLKVAVDTGVPDSNP